LIKRICNHLSRPVFEVMSWPDSELEYWSAFFSIDDNNDKPTIKYVEEELTVEESITNLKRVLS
jgi:hypothetical protein